MVVSNLENSYFFNVLRALERAARSHGYEVLVANKDHDPDRMVRSIPAPAKGFIDLRTRNWLVSGKGKD